MNLAAYVNRCAARFLNNSRLVCARLSATGTSWCRERTSAVCS